MKYYLRYLPWFFVFMAFLATSLSFLDRQVMSIAIIKINEEIPISDTEYGYINTGFLLSYAIMFTLAGILIDRWGSKIGLAYSVSLWSMATMLHAFATNFTQFAVFRFLLGLGEGGAFPGAIKTVQEWVPKNRQALANGIAIGGSAVGAVIAPPLCIYFFDDIGWRGVFLVSGIFGIFWVILWMFLPNKVYDDVDLSARRSWLETKSIIGKLFGLKDVWVFILIRFMLDPILYFYMFWIPKFLNNEKGVKIEVIGKLYWIPFLALGISNIFGGYLSDFILRRTDNLNLARKCIMGFAALLTIPAAFVVLNPSTDKVIAIMVIAFFAHGMWITNYITSISDVFGKSLTSTVVGLSGTAGALSSVIINPLMGKIINGYTYDPLWIYSGVMYSVVFIFFICAMPKIAPLKMEF